MPFGGVGGSYYPTATPTRYNTGGVTFNTTTPVTYTGAAQTTTLAPPPQPPPLPPPPVLPAPPVLPTIPQFNSTAIPQLQQLLGSFQNYNPYPALPPDVANLLNTISTQRATQLQDQQLASLFGRGVPESSIAIRESGQLSAALAAEMAAAELAARQYGGQQGLAALGAQGNVLGTLGGIESNAYSQNLQGLLGLAGLAQQQYATQGGLQNQQYATQAGAQNAQYGNQLSAYGMQAQQQLQQQQFAQDLLRMIMSGGFGALGNLGGMTGGTSGGFNFGGTSASGGGYTPQFGQQGYPNGPYGAPTTGTAPTQQQIQSLIWNYIQQILGG